MLTDPVRLEQREINEAARQSTNKVPSYLKESLRFFLGQHDTSDDRHGSALFELETSLLERKELRNRPFISSGGNTYHSLSMVDSKLSCNLCNSLV